MFYQKLCLIFANRKINDKQKKNMKNQINLIDRYGNDFSIIGEKALLSIINKEKILKIEFKNSFSLFPSMGPNLFNGFSYLSNINTNCINTSKVTNMDGMFKECKSLKDLDLSSFDTSKVATMSRILENCTNLTSLDLSNFDTSKVTDMNSMFNDCKTLTSLDISSFDFSNIEDLDFILCDCNSLTDLQFGKNLKTSIDLSDCPLSHESILSVIDGLANVKEEQTICLNEKTYLSLTDEDKKRLDSKNWYCACPRITWMEK